ncbi:hypothetical protein Tco_0833307, partial [Tanacetum coccineum]
VSVLAVDKSLLSAKVSALKSAVSQKDTDISLLDSRASYLKSALDDWYVFNYTHLLPLKTS